MWQICKTSDNEQFLLRPSLSLQHFVTGGQTEGPGPKSSVQRPGSKKYDDHKLCCLKITVFQNINLTVTCQNCGFVAFGLPSLVFWFWFFLRNREKMHLHCQALGRFKMVVKSLAPVHPCITPKCKNCVLDSVCEIPDHPLGLSVWFQDCQCLQKPQPSQMPHQSRVSWSHSCHCECLSWISSTKDSLANTSLSWRRGQWGGRTICLDSKDQIRARK